MGVEFLVCKHCGEVFPDNCVYCFCDCGLHWCSNECAALDGWYCDENDTKARCGYCQLELAEDGELLGFLLAMFNWSREEVEKRYLSQQRDLRPKDESV